MDESAGRYEIQHAYCRLQGESKFQLILFGDHVARREGYRVHEGLTAIHYYLVQKYRWLPAVVRSLCDSDLEFLLAEEMKDWVPPAEAFSVLDEEGPG